MARTLATAPARRLVELERVVRAGISTFVEVGEALATIRDEKLYLQTHSTFAEYCRDKWNFSTSAAWRKIGQARAVAALPPGQPLPSQRSLARARKASKTLSTPRAREITVESTELNGRGVLRVIEARTRDISRSSPRALIEVIVAAIDALPAGVAVRAATKEERSDISAWAEDFSSALATARSNGHVSRPAVKKTASKRTVVSRSSRPLASNRPVGKRTSSQIRASRSERKSSRSRRAE